MYIHKGSGLIVDNVFEPAKKLMNTAVENVVKPAIKKTKSTNKVVNDTLEKSGDLIMKKKLSSLRKPLTTKQTKQLKKPSEDYNIIHNYLIY